MESRLVFIKKISNSNSTPTGLSFILSDKPLVVSRKQGLSSIAIVRHLLSGPWKLILSGIIVITIVGFGGNFNRKNLVQEQSITQNSSTVEIKYKPTKISIPKLSKTLQVEDGKFENETWTISDTGVSYFIDSASPGSGNTVLYGHNKREILGDLYKVRPEDLIHVTSQDGTLYTYKVIKTEEIKPTQVEILNPTDQSILTVYTCSGLFDQKRFVALAVLDSKSKSL